MQCSPRRRRYSSTQGRTVSRVQRVLAGSLCHEVQASIDPGRERSTPDLSIPGQLSENGLRRVFEGCPALAPKAARPEDRFLNERHLPTPDHPLMPAGHATRPQPPAATAAAGRPSDGARGMQHEVGWRVHESFGVPGAESASSCPDPAPSAHSARHLRDPAGDQIWMPRSIHSRSHSEPGHVER